MRIEKIEVVPYALPFKEPYVTARGSLHRREMALLRVRDSDGLEGFGDAVPLSLRGDADLATVVQWLEGLKQLEGWEDADSVIWANGLEKLNGAPRCANPAWDSAMRDLLARETGQPVWQFMGADGVEPIRCNATLAAGAPTDVARRAGEWAESGFTTFKLKVGVAEDAEQVRAVREALGPEIKLRVDANGQWNTEDAVAWLNALESEDFELVEQPCRSLEEMAEVRRHTGIPIAADESVRGFSDAQRALDLKACDLTTVKLAKEQDPYSISILLPIYMSSALDGPAGIAQAAHLWQMIRGGPGDAGVAHGLATQRLFSDTIASRECELRDGHLHLPEGPGLGVEIDDAALERHRL